MFRSLVVIIGLIITFATMANGQSNYDTTVQDPAIAALVKKHDEIEAAMKVLVPEYDRLKTEFEAFKQQSGGGGGTTIVREVGGKDVHAQQSANRALAWAVRLSFSKLTTVEKAQVYSTATDGSSGYVKVTKESFVTYPDIEEVEEMLSPILRGNMSPAKFEEAVLKAATARGWTYLTAPAREAIIAEAIAEAKKAAEKVAGDVAKKEVEAQLGAFKQAAEEYQQAASQVDKLTKVESARLTTLATAINQALEAAARYETAVKTLEEAGYINESDALVLIDRELKDTKTKVGDLETRYENMKKAFLAASSKIAQTLEKNDTEKGNQKKQIRSDAAEARRDLEFFEKTGQPRPTEETEKPEAEPKQAPQPETE